jgi:hypothetical protein
MAKVVIKEHTVTVVLTLGEKLEAMTRNITIPRWAVLGARAVADGLQEVRGLPGPGTEVPGVRMAGTFTDRGTTTFAMCRGHGPAVLIELSGQAFDRLLVTVDDPAAIIAQLTGLTWGQGFE